MRARTSLLVTGSVLTTATMKSASRGPTLIGAAGLEGGAAEGVGTDAGAAGAARHFIGARLQLGNLGFGAVFGHGDQDHRQIQLGAGAGARAGLLADEVIDLAVADVQLGFDFALAQARQQHLIAHVLAENGHRQTVLLDTMVQFLDGRQLVAARDRQFGLRQRAVVHLQTLLARVLQLGALGDQAFQHFLAQFIGGRRGDAALCQLVHRPRHADAYFAVGDWLGVDHGDDVVGLARPQAGRRGGGRRRGREGGHGGVCLAGRAGFGRRFFGHLGIAGLRQRGQGGQGAERQQQGQDGAKRFSHKR
jgi:hypothetical protein